MKGGWIVDFGGLDFTKCFTKERIEGEKHSIASHHGRKGVIEWHYRCLYHSAFITYLYIIQRLMIEREEIKQNFY